MPFSLLNNKNLEAEVSEGDLMQHLKNFEKFNSVVPESLLIALIRRSKKLSMRDYSRKFVPTDPETSSSSLDYKKAESEDLFDIDSSIIKQDCPLKTLEKSCIGLPSL